MDQDERAAQKYHVAPSFARTVTFTRAGLARIPWGTVRYLHEWVGEGGGLDLLCGVKRQLRLGDNLVRTTLDGWRHRHAALEAPHHPLIHDLVHDVVRAVVRRLQLINLRGRQDQESVVLLQNIVQILRDVTRNSPQQA